MKAGEVGMPDREKVIKELVCLPKTVYYGFYQLRITYELRDKVVELLKDQDSEKERIMKVIWDALHEGFSIDTIADQDWVYEQIRHRIEDI